MCTNLTYWSNLAPILNSLMCTFAYPCRPYVVIAFGVVRKQDRGHKNKERNMKFGVAD